MLGDYVHEEIPPVCFFRFVGQWARFIYPYRRFVIDHPYGDEVKLV